MTTTTVNTAEAPKFVASGLKNEVTVLSVSQHTDKNGNPYAKLRANLRKQNGELSVKEDGTAIEHTILVFNQVLPTFEGQLTPGSTVEMNLYFPDKGAARAYLPKAANDDASAPAEVAA